MRHERARAVLEQGWPAGTAEPLYAKETALHFCHYHSFKAGLLFLFQRMHDPTRQLQARPPLRLCSCARHACMSIHACAADLDQQIQLAPWLCRGCPPTI